MSGLVVMGVLVVAIGGLGWAWGLSALTRRPLRESAVLLAGLPLSTLVNVYVKAPLIALVAVLFVVPRPSRHRRPCR